ncbi:hypothetical protein BaRGS_00036576, partial [Batillaria attramentaria]
RLWSGRQNRRQRRMSLSVSSEQTKRSEQDLWLFRAYGYTDAQLFQMQRLFA